MSSCRTCRAIGPVEVGFAKYGFPDDAVALRAPISALIEITSNISGGRGHTLYRCPTCGAFFDYELDYEFIVPGTEDTETLTRITDEQVTRLRARIEGRR